MKRSQKEEWLTKTPKELEELCQTLSLELTKLVMEIKSGRSKKTGQLAQKRQNLAILKTILGLKKKEEK